MPSWSTGSIGLDVVTECPEAGPTDGHGTVWWAELDGRRCRTERQFLLTVADVLGFPAYYGRNWDAFDECFSDLLDITTGGMGYEFYDRPGRPEQSLHLVVLHAEHLLVDAPPRGSAIAMHNFREPFPHYDPPQLWHRYAGLHVSLVCAAEERTAFVARLHETGLFPPDPPSDAGVG